MSELKCSAMNCAYNVSRLCGLNGIKVGGAYAKSSDSTCCESFSEGGAGMQNSMATQNPSPETNIKCMASDCVYNDRSSCTARSIEIQGYGASDSRGTRCESFRLRG